MTVDAELFVIGAGPAGLTAAYCMSKETPSVIVVEKILAMSGASAVPCTTRIFCLTSGVTVFFQKRKKWSIYGKRYSPMTS